ncbi:MAG: PAS domain S-box protein [Spirochaetes bacterium]|nr:PAS domain S-box protein [Spirochaetota bacterium]
MKQSRIRNAMPWKSPATHRRAMESMAAILFLALLLAIPWKDGRSAEPTSPPPLNVDSTITTRHVSPHLSFYVDHTGRVTIGEVSSHPERFAPIPDLRGDPSFGYSRSAYWFMFRARNSVKKPVEWILEFTYPLIDRIDLHVPLNGTYRVIKTGDSLPFGERMVEYRTFAFTLTEPPGERTYYLRVESSGSLTVPLTAWKPERFRRRINTESLIMGLSYGILLAMAIYHLFIFISIREKSYIHLTMLILAAGTFSLIHNGLAFQYFWPESPVWGNLVYPFALALGNLAALQFGRAFLGTRRRFPRGDFILIGAMAVALIIMPLSFILDYYNTVRAATLLTAVSGLLLIGAGAVSLKRGYREARYYLLACLTFFIGAILSVFRAYGLLPENPITEWSNHFGMTAMAILFSFGVSDKINVIREEREKAVESLAESENRYRTLVENAHDGIMMIVEGRTVFANTALHEILGYEPGALLSSSLDDLLPDTPLGKDLVGNRYRRRIRGGDEPTRYEGQMMRRDGTIIDCMFSASLIEIRGERVVISIISDISSLKRAERTIVKQYEEIQTQYSELEELNQEITLAQTSQRELNERLAREKEQLTAILKSIGDAVIATDGEGRVILMNSAAEDLTGKSQEEALGMAALELIRLPQGTLPVGDGSSPPLPLSDGNGSPFITDIPLTIQRGDGTECVVEIAGTPLRQPGGDRPGMVLAVRDITAKTKLEKEILKASKIESLGLLAGGIAHDFNNLLTAVIGNLSLLRSMLDESDRDRLAILERVEQASRRAANLTRQLLTFSRGGEPVKKRASVQDLLLDNIGFLLSGSAIKARFDIQQSLWPVEVDPDQISQVIHNLVINAMQAMHDGGELLVRADNLDAAPSLPLAKGRYVRISFSDQGTGIPEQNLGRVFDPYFSTKPKGTGLGLSICYSILKKHGGGIDVESAEGVGSTFHIYLPATEGEAMPKTPTTPVTGTRQGRILVMDDEEQVRNVASALLSHLGYEVECVGDGAEAVERYRLARDEGRPFSAVILDLTVPGGMGGREAVRLLLKQDPSAVALVSTGYSGDPVMANYRDFGFSGALGKPYTLNDLASVLDEVRGGSNAGNGNG